MSRTIDHSSPAAARSWRLPWRHRTSQLSSHRTIATPTNVIAPPDSPWRSFVPHAAWLRNADGGVSAVAPVGAELHDGIRR